MTNFQILCEPEASVLQISCICIKLPSVLFAGRLKLSHEYLREYCKLHQMSERALPYRTQTQGSGWEKKIEWGLNVKTLLY